MFHLIKLFIQNLLGFVVSAKIYSMKIILISIHLIITLSTMNWILLEIYHSLSSIWLLAAIDFHIVYILFDF